MNEKHELDHKMNLVEWYYRKFYCPKHGHHRNTFGWKKLNSKYCMNCGKYLGV